MNLGKYNVRRSVLRKYEVTQADSLITFESFGETTDYYYNMEDTYMKWDQDVVNNRT